MSLLTPVIMLFRNVRLCERNVARTKEETLLEFDKPELTAQAKQNGKRIIWEQAILPMIRICTIGSVGWVLAILFLYYYLPELFESDERWLKIALIGPAIIWLLFFMSVVRFWLDKFSKSIYAVTDRGIRYTGGEHNTFIRWKDVDGYTIEDEQNYDDNTQTLLLYRKNKRLRPFVLAVPEPRIEKVMQIIAQRAQPLTEDLPDFRAEAIARGENLKSMFCFSVVAGLLAGLLLQPEHFHFLRHLKWLACVLFFVVGPGTMWLLLRRPRKILDGAHLTLAVLCNITGNGIMVLILIIRYFRHLLDTP